MEILTYILGGTSITSIILFLIFFRQNRLLKNHEVSKSVNEVESGKINNDMAQIDLGTKYLNSILEATEKLNTYHTDYQNNIDSITKDISEIKKDVKSIKKEQTLMSLYLNGKYTEFKDHITNYILND
jgi:DNA repair ATPase RecN